MITKPIGKQYPVGLSCRDSDAYILLRDEIKKLAKASARESINWQVVLTLGKQILSDSSKDIQVACYVALAWVNIHSYQQILTAYNLVIGLIEQYQSNLFPQNKPLAVISTIEWLDQQLIQYCDSHQAIDYTELANIKAISNNLISNVNHCYQMEIDLHLSKYIEKQISRVVQQAEVPPQTVTDRPRQQQVIPLAIQLKKKHQQLLDEKKFNEAVFAAVRAYCWHSTAEWLSLSENTVNLVELPFILDREYLSNQDHQLEPDQKLIKLETMAMEHPYWLDCHTEVVKHCQQFEQFSPIATAVQYSLLWLIKAYPKLTTLCFNNGEPILSKVNAAFLQQQSQVFTTTTVKKTSSSNKLSRQINKLSQLAVDKHDQAVVEIRQSIAALKDIKSRVTYQIQLLSQLIAINAIVHLLPLADKLVSELQYFKLIEWDPALAKEVILLYVEVGVLMNKKHLQYFDFAMETLAELDYSKYVLTYERL